jgi:transcriptional regulator with XRE-family HTH domain
MDTFDRISELLRKNKMTQADLARKTGISTGLISQWKNRSQNPSAEKLQKVAECFNVSVDYLLGNEQKEKPTGKAEGQEITFDDFTYALHNETKKLTEENKEKLLEMARFFKEQQNKKKKE